MVEPSSPAYELTADTYRNAIRSLWVIAYALDDLPLDRMLTMQLSAQMQVQRTDPIGYARKGQKIEDDIALTRALIAGRDQARKQIASFARTRPTCTSTSTPSSDPAISSRNAKPTSST